MCLGDLPQSLSTNADVVVSVESVSQCAPPNGRARRLRTLTSMGTTVCINLRARYAASYSRKRRATICLKELCMDIITWCESSDRASCQPATGA